MRELSTKNVIRHCKLLASERHGSAAVIKSRQMLILAEALVCEINAAQKEESGTQSTSSNSAMVQCQSHKCHMCCPVGDEYCPKVPCLISRTQHQ